MRAPRVFCVWTALMVCAVLVLGAMLWLTRGVMQAERERVKAEQERTAAENRADLEERTRLALWRMDALGAAIMLRENRYSAMDYVGTAFESRPVEPEVLLHFQIHEGQAPTTPEFGMVDAPGASTLDAAFPERRERVRRLREFLAANPLPGNAWTQLNNAVTEGQVSWDAVSKDATKEQSYNIIQRQNKKGDELRKDETYQAYSNTTEKAQRAKAVAQSVDNAYSQSDQEVETGAPQQQMAADFSQEDQVGLTSQKAGDVGQMRAVWVGGELFLLRQVIWNLSSVGTRLPKGKRSSVQGVWLDSLKLRERLLGEVADLLPNAKLLAVEGKQAEDPLAMVSFPFRLERNEAPVVSNEPVGIPFGAPLWVAWGAVALAVAASSLLVRGVMRLSERRASFVSAVTHELRTPLTTFRLYSDMLETGAVKPEKRGEYLRVLSREADRLSHLVENVLAFSRIERGNARSNVRESAVGDLLEQSRERLEARLATAGLSLEMDSLCALQVRLDTAAVEHILFNLVDNAAKYAAGSNPPVVKIHARAAGRFAEILVRDHGPGIPASEQGRIFRAFHKSAREAAESKPGVGLGLALSRRLAREQGGDLQCAGEGNGACFILRLPRVGVAL